MLVSYATKVTIILIKFIQKYKTYPKYNNYSRKLHNKIDNSNATERRELKISQLLKYVFFAIIHRYKSYVFECEA